MPVNTSAILTVQDVQVVGSGRNLGDLTKYQADFVSTKTSQHNTSQVTMWEQNLGIISNAGQMFHIYGECWFYTNFQ